jgi:ketosteroid isomerase-like protein
MSQEYVETLREAFDAFNRRDFDAAIATVAEEITWEPFLSETETPLLRGKEQVRAAWEAQVVMMDVRVETEELIPVGEHKVVACFRLIAQGHGSGMPLDAPVIWVFTSGDDRLTTSVERYDSRDEALEALGLSE